MSEHEIDIAVIVNGQPVAERVHEKTLLRDVVKRALDKSGNSGQPIENWELRDSSGQLLDLSKTIGQVGTVNGAKLFLNLKAGVGG